MQYCSNDNPAYACNGRSEKNVVRVWWPAMRGARPPRLLFSCLAARPEQPPGLVVQLALQEKQSFIALLLIAHSALRGAMGMPDLM